MLESFVLLAVESHWISGKKFSMHRSDYARIAIKDRILTLDHIEPLSRGGAHDIENAAAVCRFCNSSKRNTSLLVWFARKAA